MTSEIINFYFDELSNELKSVRLSNIDLRSWKTNHMSGNQASCEDNGFIEGIDVCYVCSRSSRWQILPPFMLYYTFILKLNCRWTEKWQRQFHSQAGLTHLVLNPNRCFSRSKETNRENCPSAIRDYYPSIYLLNLSNTVKKMTSVLFSFQQTQLISATTECGIFSTSEKLTSLATN